MDIAGHTVRTVMVAEGADIAAEYYFSLLLDRASRGYLAMCSVEGGMDIETLAVERPEALARMPVDPLVGLDQRRRRPRSWPLPASPRRTGPRSPASWCCSARSTATTTPPWSR